MQFSLFASQDKMSKDYSSFIKDIKSSGKVSKFLDCRIRKFFIEQGKDSTAILKALQDLETIGIGLCMEASKISSPRPLKTSDLNNVFRSVISNRDLTLESSADLCWNSFFDLKDSISRNGIKLSAIIGQSKNPSIIMIEKDITERYVDLLFAITRLGLIMRNEIEYDIQGR